MQVGDLVLCRSNVAMRRTMYGLIIEEVRDPMAMSNQVFKVLWKDGTVGNNVWDYDLKVINGN
jgi:hypothetical protein